jgi:hypothetical protein
MDAALPGAPYRREHTASYRHGESASGPSTVPPWRSTTASAAMRNGTMDAALPGAPYRRGCRAMPP